MIVHIFPVARVQANHKVADAELHFTEGPLAGTRLLGFSIFKREQGDYTVTWPSRQYNVNGERRSFALLRPIDLNIPDARDKVRDLILDALVAWTAAQEAAKS